MKNLLAKHHIRPSQPPTHHPADVVNQKYTRSRRELVKEKASEKGNPSTKAPTQSSSPSKTHLPATFLKNHLFFSPFLLLALLGYGATSYILLNIPPSQVQHVLIPNLYLPILLTALLGHFGFFSFIFTNFRRGLLLAIFLTALLFLRLQHVLTLPAAAICLLPLLLLELCLTILSRWR